MEYIKGSNNILNAKRKYLAIIYISIIYKLSQQLWCNRQQDDST